jgi:hypothetical protein
MSPRKLREFDCACGCGGRTRGGEFLPGHDQTLRTAIETQVGGLLELRALVEKTIGCRIEVPEAVFMLTPKGEAAEPSASQNIPSWNKVRSLLLKQGRATLTELVNAVDGHDHEAGEKAFIWYCYRRLGWLKPVKLT